LGFLHHNQIKNIFCSDIDDDILTVARRNLGLLTSGGIDARIETIAALYKQFGKLSHRRALESAYRLKTMMQDSAIETRCFNSNILHAPDYLLITKMKIDIIFADIPYEFLAIWQGNISGKDEVWLTLDNLLPVVNPNSLIVIASAKKTTVEHRKYTRIRKISIGRRKIAMFRPLN
jgi:16S rRNA G966 N2-methylase RsmD